MTIAGQIFKGYAEAIVSRYGFGSNKMVFQWDNKRRDELEMKGQRLVDKGTHAKNSFSILASELEDALASEKEGLKLWDEMMAADKWLLENGYIREYSFSTHNTVAGTNVLCNFRHYTKYGLTKKGWSVANKYLNAE